MHYNALRHWSKFHTSLTTFQWVTSKKSPRSTKIVLYAGMKTFEISKLQNYKSYINETWRRYVSPEHLQYTKK